MAGSGKRAGKRSSAGNKGPGKAAKSGFTPEELRFRTRFLSSNFGRFVIGLSLFALLLALLALVAGQNINLFFLLTGLALLAAMVAFWLFLLFRRTARHD